MTARASRSLPAGAAIIAVACLTAIGSYQKLRELERSDSALYAYGAFVIEQGGRLYRDIWDHKPPGVYVINAMAFRLAGEVSWSAAVAADTIATLAAIAACAAIAWRITSRLPAACVAAATAAFYLNLAAFHKGGGMAEIYMVACLAWAGWAFLMPGSKSQGRFCPATDSRFGCHGPVDAALRPQTRAMLGSGQASRLGDTSRRPADWLVLSGVLVGLAILFKPTALTTAAACAVTLGIEAWHRRRLVHLARAVAAFVAGLAGPLLAAGLVFWRQGSLGELVDASLLYNLSYVERGAALSKLWTFHVRHNAYLLAGVLVVLGAILLRPREPRQRAGGPGPATWRIFLPTWLLFEWAGIYAGNFDNGQYLFACTIPLSCMVGVAGAHLLRLARRTDEPRASAVAAVFLALGLALAWWPARDQWRRTVALARGQVSELAMDQVRAAAWIQDGCGPADRVWVWGYAPQVYLRAQRQPATRFVFDGAFLNSQRVMRAEFREMLEDLERTQPTYIVDAATTGWFGVWLAGPVPERMPRHADAYRTELGQLKAWVAEHYATEAEYGELLVYRRRAVPAGQPDHWQPAHPWPQDGPASTLGRGW